MMSIARDRDGVVLSLSESPENVFYSPLDQSTWTAGDETQRETAQSASGNVTEPTDPAGQAERAARAKDREDMAERCKRAAAEHYMNLGSLNALSIADLQRKHGILHRTSLVRMIDKMKVLKDSSSVPAPAPHVRLTHDDIFGTDLDQPGTLKRLLRKLHRTGPKRRAPGAACARCRLLKKSCDGCAPCSNCVLTGETCTKDDASLMVVTFNPEPPVSQGLVLCRSPKPKPTDPMRPNLGGMGLLLDFGWKPHIIASMIGSCPLKLRCALDRLSCVIKPMLRSQAAKRKPLPDIDLSMFESERVTRTRWNLQADGSTVACFNDRASEVYGVHKEEFAARMGSRDMPMWHTEYRMMCWQLELLYQTCFNEAGTFDIFTPFRMNCFKAGGKLEEKWHVYRWKHSLFADGAQSTAVLITPEEFDRGVAQRSDAMGVFAECTFSGPELYSTSSLYQREQISAIAGEERGRRMLHELADKVVKYFRLDEVAPHPTSQFPA